MNSEMIADFFARFSIQCDKNALFHMEQAIEKGKTSLESLAHTANNVTETLKIAFAGFAGIEGIKKVFEVNTELNNTFNQLVNATSSTEIAQNQLTNLIQFADKTKLSILSLSESFGSFANQMQAAGLSIATTSDIFQKMQVAFAGAHLTAFQAQLSSRDVTEFITGATSLSRLKRMEIGLHTAIIPNIEKKLGVHDPKKLDEIVKAMSGEQRAKLIADVGYDTYAKGQEEYAKGSMAALQNVKNKFTKLAKAIGESGFMDVAIRALNGFSSALNSVIQTVQIASNVVSGIKNAFSEMPAVMWTVVGSLTALTLAFNRAKIAMLAEIVVEKILIAWDSILAVMNRAVALSELFVAAPLWLIVSAVVAIIAAISLLVDDMYAYFHGGKSITGLVVNALKKAFQSFLTWFERIGIVISTWIEKHVQGWIKKIDEIGERIAKNIFNFVLSIASKVVSVFEVIKKYYQAWILFLFQGIKSYFQFVLNMFTDIKNFIRDIILHPIALFERLIDKMKSLAGKSWDGIKNKLGENSFVITHLAQNASANLKGDMGRNYLGAIHFSDGIVSGNQAMTRISNHYFSPNTHVHVSGGNSLDKRQLASEINRHLNDTLSKHYSAALADATRRE